MEAVEGLAKIDPVPLLMPAAALVTVPSRRPMQRNCGDVSMTLGWGFGYARTLGPKPWCNIKWYMDATLWLPRLGPQDRVSLLLIDNYSGKHLFESCFAPLTDRAIRWCMGIMILACWRTPCAVLDPVPDSQTDSISTCRLLPYPFGHHFWRLCHTHDHRAGYKKGAKP